MIPTRLIEELKPYVVLLVLTVILDAGWLVYRQETHKALFQEVQGSPLKVRWIPAILVYVVIATAVYHFAVLGASSLKEAMLRGAGIGLAMYGLYDLTNYATFSGWTLSMTLTDMLWGTVLCSLVAGASFFTLPFLPKIGEYMTHSESMEN